MYDPNVGRWLSEDPIGFEAGDANVYRYVGNFATGAVDPSGLAPPGMSTRPLWEGGGGSVGGDSNETVLVEAAIAGEMLGGDDSLPNPYSLIKALGSIVVSIQGGDPQDFQDWLDKQLSTEPPRYTTPICDKHGNIIGYEEHEGVIGMPPPISWGRGGISRGGLRPPRTQSNPQAVPKPRQQPPARPPQPSTSVGVTRPTVSDPKLKNLVKDLFKGDKTPNPIGTGSTADAIRHEMRTGQRVGGRWHTQKGRDYSRALEKWLKNNPNASRADRCAAQQILDDLRSALGGN